MPLFPGCFADDADLQFLINGVVGKVAVGPGHNIISKLGCLLSVAGGAVLGTDNNMNIISVVFECIGMLVRSESMTLCAADGFSPQIFGNIRARYFTGVSFNFHRIRGGGGGVATVSPILHNTGVDAGMTIQAFSCFIADGTFGGDTRNC